MTASLRDDENLNLDGVPMRGYACFCCHICLPNMVAPEAVIPPFWCAEQWDISHPKPRSKYIF
jgi:hypothetical protein